MKNELLLMKVSFLLSAFIFVGLLISIGTLLKNLA